MIQNFGNCLLKLAIRGIWKGFYLLLGTNHNLQQSVVILRCVFEFKKFLTGEYLGLPILVNVY